MRIAKHQTVCEWIGAEPSPPTLGSKLGLAVGSLTTGPIHGLRHPTSDEANGWYIWCGELSEADDFFSPLHVEHLAEYLPAAIEYLALPPGYRFLVDGADYEDVWFDASLLEV
ncbi:hypothetical protein [Pseudoxanthomonas sp. PXM03]|uniref:immunity protein Imm33 domain-containing protein n=1 Tax=Pseudoxanthomonas sp. PXM03 TaxID=2769284 RepID=UPI001CE12EE2|nr:hypothetical protein [Pseudoxanthomonas sp. PXM03]